MDALTPVSQNPLTGRDLVGELLAGKRNRNTRRGYARDIFDFFTTVVGSQPTPEMVMQFFSLDRFDALGLVLRYRAILFERG